MDRAVVVDDDDEEESDGNDDRENGPLFFRGDTEKASVNQDGTPLVATMATTTNKDRNVTNFILL
jgi:hypothetical protein